MADDTMATCSTAQWTFNSRNQSPCVVGSALAGACVGGDFTLNPLEPDYVYLGPSTTAATPCRCSSVYYSMLSACAACQGNTFLGWGRYSTNCTTVFMSVFPRAIPANIAVPAWAYMDIAAAGDVFNLTLAQSFGGVESAAPAQQSSTASTTSRGLTGTNAPAGTATNTGTPRPAKSNNAGAIAGGVVGGVVGLALIAGLIFFLLRRRNKQKHLPPSSLYGPNSLNEKSNMPATMNYTGDGSTLHSSGAQHQPQVYDPNNPATYPLMGDGSNGYNTPPPGQHNFATNAPPGPGYGQNYGAQQPGGFMGPHVTGQSANSGYTQANSNYTQANTSITQPSGPRYTGAPEL